MKNKLLNRVDDFEEKTATKNNAKLTFSIVIVFYVAEKARKL